MTLSTLQRLSNWDYVADSISVNFVVIFGFLALLLIIFHALGIDPDLVTLKREQKLSEDKKTQVEQFIKLIELNLRWEEIRLQRNQWEHEINKMGAEAPANSSA